MVYIKSASNSSDHTFDDVQTILLTQVDMNLSIIFACFIFLKPFMDGLQTGLLASDIQILSSKKSSRNGTFGLGTWSKKNRKDEIDLGLHERLDTQESTKQVIVKTSEIKGVGPESMRTGDGSAKDTIKKTTDIVQRFGPRESK